MIDVSCAFAPGPDTPDHVALAESLGYRRAWCYDSPAAMGDVWMTLARVAERTSRIGIGPAALVPSLRHVMVTASSIANLVQLAPGRAAVAVGSGNTGRVSLGQRPLRWIEVAAYLRALRALLRGEKVEVDGGVVAMLHPAGALPAFPIDVPVLVAAEGPKGLAVARELGDGVFCSRPQPDFDWCAAMAFGTVLDEGEDVAAERVLAAAGPGVVGGLHFLYEHSRPEVLDTFPGGAEWRRAIEAIPGPLRHLQLYRDYLRGVTELDRLLLSPEVLRAMSWTGTADELRPRLQEIARSGVTELVYQPSGPDVPRELRAFACMARLQSGLVEREG